MVVGQRRIRGAAAAPRRLSLPDQRLEPGDVSTAGDRSDARRARAARRSGARAGRARRTRSRSRSTPLSNPPEAPPPADRRRTLPAHAAAGRRLSQVSPSSGERWATSNRWKPCVYAVITVALKEAPLRAGPIVTTTLHANAAARRRQLSEHALFHIGGTCATPPCQPPPVPLRVGRAADAGLERALASHARRCARAIRVRRCRRRAPGGCAPAPHRSAPALPRDIAVPEPTGNYDVAF